MSARSITTALAAGVDAQDRQRHQDRVGIVLLDRLVERRAGRRLVMDVAADELDLVPDALEDKHPLVVEVERLAGQAMPRAIAIGQISG